jgi:hypothetical protein
MMPIVLMMPMVLVVLVWLGNGWGLMMLMVFVLSFPFLAKEKHPDQYADCHQQEGPGYDEKIRPGWRHLIEVVIHDVKK